MLPGVNAAMVPAIALWLLRGKSLPDLVDLAAELGFGGVSFNNSIADASAEVQEACCQRCKAASMVVTFHFAIDRDGSQADALKQLDRLLEPVRRFISESAPVAAVTFDPCTWQSQSGRSMGYAAEKTAVILHRAWQELSRHGVSVGVENWPGITTSPAAFEFLTEMFPDMEIGILLDLGHLNIDYHRGNTGLLDPPGYIAALPLPIVELHVHDNNGRRDSHDFPGDGNCDFEAIFRALADAGFDGVCTLEAAPNLIQLDATRPDVLEALKAGLNCILQFAKKAGLAVAPRQAETGTGGTA